MGATDVISLIHLKSMTSFQCFEMLYVGMLLAVFTRSELGIACSSGKPGVIKMSESKGNWQ